MPARVLQCSTRLLTVKIVVPRLDIASTSGLKTLVERPHNFRKNGAEVEHIRHFLQESCKYLTFQTKIVRFRHIRPFLQIQTVLTKFLQVKTICLKMNKNLQENI